MRTLNSAFVVCLVVASTTWSAEKRAFTIEDLHKIKSISGLQISPDGKSVLYLLETMDLGSAKRTGHVWIMGIDGQNAYQLTESPQGESSPGFSPSPGSNSRPSNGFTPRAGK